MTCAEAAASRHGRLIRPGPYQGEQIQEHMEVSKLLPIKLSHEEAVVRLRELDRQDTMSAFEMGDIALERCPLSEIGPHSGAGAELERLANDAGIEASTLQDRRLVAARVPSAARAVFGSFKAYRVAAYADATVRPALLERMQRANPDHSQGRWTVDAVHALRNSMEVAAQRAGKLAKPNKHWSHAPEVVALNKTLYSGEAALDAEGVLHKLMDAVRKANEDLDNIFVNEPPAGSDLGRLKLTIARLRELVDRVEDWITYNGKTDLEAGIEKLLRESRSNG